ncbi:MAG: hypothetical protein HYV09_35260 [Deltaproteobacteria bacterium]|nr:hypothetical protein [Deltaproteobacteria bacterium]
MRALALCVLFALLPIGCGADDTPAAAADTGAVEDAADTGPVDKCATVKCAAPTVCDPLDGVCKAKFTKLGAPCGGDAGATCTGATGATCLEGDFVDGYCTVTPCGEGSPCPLGSSCAKLGGKAACFVHCKIDADCRGGGDYKCQDVGSLFVSGGSRRVCYLPSFPCTSGADCPKPLACTDGKTCT